MLNAPSFSYGKCVTRFYLFIFCFQEQLNQANEEILKRKQLFSEQEKLAEMRVLEYQKQKAVYLFLFFCF